MILFTGVAGAGKSVQGRRLADDLGYPWLSTGEFLRMMVSGQRRHDMVSGKLLGDEEIIELVDKIFRVIDPKEESILDGFPRTLPQAEWLIAQHKAGLVPVSCVVHLSASESVVAERLLARGRQDDTEESIKQRFAEYQAVTMPILERYKAEGIPVYEIDAAQDPDTVYAQIRAKLAA